MTTATRELDQTTPKVPVRAVRGPDPELIRFLRHRARCLAGCDSDAGDLVQDTLERAIRRWSTSWNDENARRWMLTVLRNLHVDRVRSAASRVAGTVNTDFFDSVPAVEADELPVWRTFDPDRIEEALEKLPHLQRRLLRMQAAGQSLREIGAALGTKPATIGTKLFRARNRLRALLGIPPEPKPGRRRHRRRARATG